MKRPSRPNQETLVRHWNVAYRVGTPVQLREDDRTITETKTRSAAWLLGGHTAVVQVDRKVGCFALERVKAIL